MDAVRYIDEHFEKLKLLQTSPPKIGVQDLVSQFKVNVDRINADVLSQKTSGMLVDSVEVEVRGGIDVHDGLHITQLPASALGVQSVSEECQCVRQDAGDVSGIAAGGSLSGYQNVEVGFP